MKIKITVNIKESVISNALVGAFEGGSNYWLHEANQVAGDTPSEKGVVWWGSENILNERLKIELKYDNPKDGKPIKTAIIGWKDFEKGLILMAKEQPRHFNDLISGNDDAITHDVFIQMVLFKEVIYG